jgi:hypothetical protein
MFRGIDYIYESDGKGQCLYDDVTLGSKSKAVERPTFTRQITMEMGWVLTKGKKLTTLCGTIIDHFDVGPEDEHFAKVAHHVYTEIGEVAKTLI